MKGSIATAILMGLVVFTLSSVALAQSSPPRVNSSLYTTFSVWPVLTTAVQASAETENGGLDLTEPLRVRPYASVWAFGVLSVVGMVATGAVGIVACIRDWQYRHDPTPTIHENLEAYDWSMVTMGMTITSMMTGVVAMVLWVIQKDRAARLRIPGGVEG